MYSYTINDLFSLISNQKILDFIYPLEFKNYFQFPYHYVQFISVPIISLMLMYTDTLNIQHSITKTKQTYAKYKVTFDMLSI